VRAFIADLVYAPLEAAAAGRESVESLDVLKEQMVQ
jgi:hypothetical protein